MIKIKPPIGSDEILIMIYTDGSRNFAITKSSTEDILDIYELHEVEFYKNSSLEGYIVYKDIKSNIVVRYSKYDESDIWRAIDNPDFYGQYIKSIA